MWLGLVEMFTLSGESLEYLFSQRSFGSGNSFSGLLTRVNFTALLEVYSQLLPAEATLHLVHYCLGRDSYLHLGFREVRCAVGRGRWWLFVLTLLCFDISPPNVVGLLRSEWSSPPVSHFSDSFAFPNVCAFGGTFSYFIRVFFAYYLGSGFLLRGVSGILLRCGSVSLTYRRVQRASIRWIALESVCQGTVCQLLA